MFSIRRTLSFAAIAAALAVTASAGPAAAGQFDKMDYGKTMTYGHKVMPSVTSNSLTANNLAVGQHNRATQTVIGDQSGGWGYYGGPTSNSITANNIAAGFGNKATQTVVGQQRGGDGPTFNSLSALNLAAGIGNRADQLVVGTQR